MSDSFRPPPRTDAIGLPTGPGTRQITGWILGPLLVAITLLFPAPPGLSEEGWRTAGVAGLMAVFWIAECMPIPATALLPLALFPLLGLGNIRDSSAPYANPIIYLFLAGFLIALAMERWNLHRRIAINLIAHIGVKPKRIIAGFLVASAFLSMWVSNTATALMMLPIALSVVRLIPESERSQPALRAFSTALLLAVAYGATTGGMATLIGTPPNALLAAYLESTYGVTIGFGQWMAIGVPVAGVGLVAVYVVLTRVSFSLECADVPGLAGLLHTEKSRLGALSRGEWGVAVVFVLTALAWIFQPVIARFVPLISDTTIGIIGALALFLIPVDLRRGEFVMNWESAKGLPWDVILLFGGGLSLAAAIERHGLAGYMGAFFSGLEGVPFLLLMALICFTLLMLTELTSNTATAATFLPVVAVIALTLGQNPLYLAIPAALATNCSYMMPVGTPPNAIVFGSGLITLPEMVRVGWLLNLCLLMIVLLAVIALGPWVFGIQFDVIPEWAR
jgi:solute carrier family 13 (sodium-dependent dicarboxylate transporter), member 2/3/5